MPTLYYLNPYSAIHIGGGSDGGGTAGHLLDSNYAYGTGGDSTGVRLHPPKNGVHLHYAFFFLHAADSTGCDLLCELRNCNTTYPLRPGTLIRSVTAAGGTSPNKWIGFDFTAYDDALDIRNPYWLVVGNPQGATYPGYSIRNRTYSYMVNMQRGGSPMGMMFTTTAGWTANGSGPSGPWAYVFVWSDGTVSGSSIVTGSSPPSTNVERGMRIDGFTEDIEIVGLWTTTGAGMEVFRIYEGDAAPGGALYSGFNGGSAYTRQAEEILVSGFLMFQTPVILRKGRLYRFVFSGASASSAPQVSNILDPDTLGAYGIAASVYQGKVCYCVNNAGAWKDYNNTTDGMWVPRMGLIVRDQVAYPSAAEVAAATWAYGNRELT
jgi:hypothetical protein